MNTCKVSFVKETSHCWDSGAVTLPRAEIFPAGTSAPSHLVTGTLLDSPKPHSLGQTRFPYWIHPRIPITESQMSSSIKQFIHGTLTQKQPQLFCTNKATAGLLCPLSVPTGNSRSSCEVFLSCWVSQCPSTWLSPPVFMPFVKQSVGISQPLV